MDLVDAALQGTTVTVETTLTPPITVDLTPSPGGGPPSAVASLLRPKVTVRRGDTVLIARAPWGEPSEVALITDLLIVVAATLFLVALVNL